MKQIFKMSLLSASILLVAACGEQQVKQEEKAVELTTETQKQAYALGGNLASFLKGRVDMYKEAGVELDTALIVKGLQDTLDDKPQIPAEEFETLLKELEKGVVEKRKEMAAQEAVANRVAGEAFMKKNGEREGVVTTDSGLQYEVVETGTGAKPAETDTVKVHYTGTLIDGTKFDSSVDRGEPAVFPLNRVISGWTEGLQLMPVGSKYRFYIPADLGYGDRAMGGTIKPGSTLVFDVELIEIPNK